MKKKMLWVGSNHGQSSLRLKVLSNLFKMFIIDEHPPSFVPGISRDYITTPERILRKLGIYLDKEKVNKTILKVIKYKKFDYIWIENEGAKLIKKNTLNILRNKKINIILYSSDNLSKIHNLSINLLRCMKLYDSVILTKSTDMKNKKLIFLAKDQKKFFFVRKAFDPHLHRKNKKKGKKKYQISFIGTFEKFRYKSLIYVANKLKKNNKKIKINVWGNGWPKRNFNCPNLKINNFPVYDKNFVNIVHNSSINLNFLRKINDDISTDRTSEIPACGSFMLSEYTDEQNEIFENGKEASYFENDEDLYKKIIYFLNRPKLIKKISINGYKKSRNLKLDHTNIIKNVLKKILSN